MFQIIMSEVYRYSRTCSDSAPPILPEWLNHSVERMLDWIAGKG